MTNYIYVQKTKKSEPHMPLDSFTFPIQLPSICIRALSFQLPIKDTSLLIGPLIYGRPWNLAEYSLVTLIFFSLPNFVKLNWLEIEITLLSCLFNSFDMKHNYVEQHIYLGKVYDQTNKAVLPLKILTLPGNLLCCVLSDQITS